MRERNISAKKPREQRMGPTESFLIITGLLLFASVLASKGASRFGIPALLVFLGVGMFAGSQGPGGVAFANYGLVQTIGVLALISILFSGGLDTNLDLVRPVLGSGIVLSTVGVLLATGMVGWFATTFLHFSWVEGLLLGAIVSSTDVAAVFTVLRSRSVSLKDRLKPLLELESAINDPMTVFLSVGLLQLYARGENNFKILIPMFLQQTALGVLVGYAAGRLIIWVINHLKLEFEGLYPVVTVSLILLTYGVTQTLGGSGFLAVYVAGIVLGNGNFLKRKSLILFHDGLAWLMQIAMFLSMGLIVLPKSLLAIAGSGIALSLFLVFIARPLSVNLCLLPFHFNWRERIMVSWGGLRGAVPIILATYPFIAGVPRAHTIFDLVFFVVFTSVLLQGAFLPTVARWLKVDSPVKQKFRYPLEYVPTGNLKSELAEVPVPGESSIVGKSLLDLGLPAGVLVVLIHRNDEVIVPRGGTTIEPDDVLLVLAETDAIKSFRSRVVQSYKM
jgi:cell volume regulation protein A